jgi:hypothetical protein
MFYLKGWRLLLEFGSWKPFMKPKKNKLALFNVSDQGSGAFFTPLSRIRDGKKKQDPDPG